MIRINLSYTFKAITILGIVLSSLGVVAATSEKLAATIVVQSLKNLQTRLIVK